METLDGKIAVVTGAASGIGLGMVEAFAARGMQVVMADIEAAALDREAARLTDAGFTVATETVDVADYDSVARLAAAAVERFGKIHVLCNNAGVSGRAAGRPIWTLSQNEWDWVVGVNFWGVVNGLRAFVPGMIAHGEAGRVVNTASILGLTTGPGSIYGVTKHAVVRLTEGLYHDLKAADSRIGATLLCPGLIATNIITSARNRPDHLQDEAAAPPGEMMVAIDAYFKREGMAPGDVGETVVEAILHDRFYVLTHAETMEGIERRFEDIRGLRNPAPPNPRRLGI
jgi:NAD(P)-dependent dehydrogenase (short-subunit alcohol dehydrogenase family)